MVSPKIGYTVQVAVLGLTGVLVSSGGTSRGSNAAQQNSEAHVTVVASVSNHKSSVSSLPSRPIVPIPMDLECIELSVSTDSGDEIDEVKTSKGTNGTSHLAIWSNTEEALQDGSTIALETKFRNKGKNRAKKIQVSIRLMRGGELITVGVSTVRVPGPTFPSMMMDVPIVSTPGGSSLTARLFGRNRKEGENHVDRSTASLRSVSFTADPYRRYELEKDATLRVQIQAIPTTEYKEKTGGSKVTGSAQKQEVGMLLQTPSSDSGVSSISHTVYSGDEDSIASIGTNERDTKLSPLNLALSPKSHNAVGGKPPMSDIPTSVLSPQWKFPPSPFSAQESVNSKKMNASPVPSNIFGDAVSPTTAGNFQSILVPESEQTGDKEDMLLQAIEKVFALPPKSQNLDKPNDFISPKSGIHNHDSDHQENPKEAIRHTSSKQSNYVGQKEKVSKTAAIPNNFFEHVNDDNSTGSTISTLTNPKIHWNNKKQAGSYESNSFEDGNGKSERMNQNNIDDSLVKTIMSQFFCAAQPNSSSFEKQPRKDARKETLIIDRKEGKLQLPAVVNAIDDEVSIGDLTNATMEQMEQSNKIHNHLPVSFGGKGFCSSMPQGDNTASQGSPAMIQTSSRFLPKSLNGDNNSGRQTSKNEPSHSESSIFSAAFQSGVDAARSKLVDLGDKFRESTIDDYSVSTTESNCENRDDVAFKHREKRPVDHSSKPPRREGPLLSTRSEISNLRRKGNEREGNSSKQGQDSVRSSSRKSEREGSSSKQGQDSIRSSSRKSAGFKRREQDSFAAREEVREKPSHDDEASNDTFSLMSDEGNDSDDSSVAESDVPSRKAASVARSTMTFTV